MRIAVFAATADPTDGFRTAAMAAFHRGLVAEGEGDAQLVETPDYVPCDVAVVSGLAKGAEKTAPHLLARRAVAAGVSALSVSNHGGNNLDGTPATIRALAAVAEAVGGEVEVLLDGGVRRGSDVVKALALGARAVMIGRPYLWGLAVDGQAGVENVLDVLRSGIDSALLGLGRASVHDLRPSDLLIPDGFSRRLGAGARA